MDNRESKITKFPWTTLIIAIALVSICVLIYQAYLVTGRTAKELLHTGAQQLPVIAEKFKNGTITTTFIGHIPEVSSTQGDVLELATARSDESFRREDRKTILWDYFSLGTTVSEIRVPVTFRYHLRLSDTWQLATRDNVCLVLAPSIRASLPPAIHTDDMEQQTVSGWARFNKRENLSALERSITPTLEQRAQDSNHLRLVREASRQSVAAFVKKWLMRENHWRHDRFKSIIVVFADEAAFPSAQELEQYQAEPIVTLD